MESNIQQATSDLAAPTIVAGIGLASDPQYFQFLHLTFEQQVAVVATVVGTVWGVINIGKFCYHAYLSIREYLILRKA